MQTKTVEFDMTLGEATKLRDALHFIAEVGDQSALESDQVGRIDWFVGRIGDGLKGSDGDTVRLSLPEDVWNAIMYVNGDLTILSAWSDEDGDPDELAAIDLVNEFLIASGRKLDRSIFRSPEDKKEIEEALGKNLDHLE